MSSGSVRQISKPLTFASRSRQGIFIVGAFIVCLTGCSRSGLLPGEGNRIGLSAQEAEGGSSSVKTDARSGNTSLGGVAGSSTPPTTASRRWVVTETIDSSDSVQLFAFRLGQSRVEDLVRLDTETVTSTYKSGQFSPNGRGFAVVEGTIGDSIVATRLIDFDFPRPKTTNLKKSQSGQTNQFGPWLDDHRIIVYESTDYRNFYAENCRIVDLDNPNDEQAPFDFGIPGAKCIGHFEVSPRGRWLLAYVELIEARALLIASIETTGLGVWTKIADLTREEAPATVTYSGDEQHVAIMEVQLGTGSLANHISVAKLSHPPIALENITLPGDCRPNYVMMAPTGSRMFVHTTRLIENNRGTNPIWVFDLESESSGEVTSYYFSSSSLGFTADGGGLLTYGYNNEFGSHGIEWIEVGNPPVVATPIALEGKNGVFVRGGQLNRDGKHYYGISGSIDSDFPAWHGPIDLLRFDFTPQPSTGTHLLRMSEYSNVDNWLFSPDLSALVFRVAVTSSTYESADPVTQGHYVSEFGTYWAKTSGSGPTRLGLTWSAYDQYNWLPDSSGLLRISPEGEPSVVTDAYSSDGRGLSYVNENDRYTLQWLRLEGGQGVVTDLSAFLQSGYRIRDTSSVNLPRSWSEAQ
jgi:hypothetical protein